MLTVHKMTLPDGTVFEVAKASLHHFTIWITATQFAQLVLLRLLSGANH